MHVVSIENFDLLRRFECICKKARAPQSWAQDEYFNEKTEDQKSLDTVPLRIYFKYCQYNNLLRYFHILFLQNLVIIYN
jgi:hypothetical protein